MGELVGPRDERAAIILLNRLHQSVSRVLISVALVQLSDVGEVPLCTEWWIMQKPVTGQSAENACLWRAQP